MTNNTTSLNETNPTIWQVNDISGVQKSFEEGQRITSELLVSWDMIPEAVYFRLLVVLGGVLVLYQLFVSGSSKAGSGFRYILMAVLVITILIALGII